MMMAPPQVVGVLLKKPGQRDDSRSHPRIPPLDPQEIKIRGELYVEDLGEQRMVTIRMGWLWVEGNSMKLPLRALNLRQAPPSLCQPHASALGFTLSNPQNGTLATFWADTEPIYWSWVRAIAAELVRQTPFRAQRCLNFLEILTICPRGPVPLPDSPTESRRRSRSELRSWFRNSSGERQTNILSTLEESRRRARSELRGWSSNSSDEDVLGEFRTIPVILPKEAPPRPWAFSESSEGSDDSLPWGGGQSSVDSVDSVNGPTTPIIPEPETREQRIQRYKEARRRENEARCRRVVEEDARRRKAKAEENNNVNNNNHNVSLTKLTRACYPSVDLTLKNLENNNNNNTNNTNNKNHNQNVSQLLVRRNCVDPKVRDEKELDRRISSRNTELIEGEKSSLKKSTLVKVPGNFVRFEEQKNLANVTPVQTKTDAVAGERRSRARERRGTRERTNCSSTTNTQVETLRERKERLASLCSRIPIPHFPLVSESNGSFSTTRTPPKSPTYFSVVPEPCEEAVARLLERCQRVDHYVPVRDKLTLFESLSRLGGRLARSTEDLGRAKTNPSPRGKQRARSLHDLSRAAKSVPVREMCRFFEGEKFEDASERAATLQRTRFSESSTLTRSRAWSDGGLVPSTLTLPQPTALQAPTKSSSKRRQYVK